MRLEGSYSQLNAVLSFLVQRSERKIRKMGSGSNWKTFSQETPSDREVILVTVRAYSSSWVDIGTWYDKLKTVCCESDHYATDLKTSESRIAVAWMKIPDAYQACGGDPS